MKNFALALLILTLATSGLLFAQVDQQTKKELKNSLEIYGFGFQASYSRKLSDAWRWRIYLEPLNRMSLKQTDHIYYDNHYPKNRDSYHFGGRLECSALYSFHQTKYSNLFFGIGPTIYYVNSTSNEDGSREHNNSEYNANHLSHYLSFGVLTSLGISVHLSERFSVFTEYGIRSTYGSANDESENSSSYIHSGEITTNDKSKYKTTGWYFSDRIHAGISVAF